MKRRVWTIVLGGLALLSAATLYLGADLKSAGDCLALAEEGFRPIARQRISRFLGKVQVKTASCRGGQNSVGHRQGPWVDWQYYWGTGDSSSLGKRFTSQNQRGVLGALNDLEYQRMELIRFNVFDNSGTFETYQKGRGDTPGPSVSVWPQMGLGRDDPEYAAVTRPDGTQLCWGDLIRFRTLTGICNDIRNPAMGATHQLFGRMVEFESTFPDLARNELAQNRHGGRIRLLQPDPEVISRRLFTRAQSHPEKCNSGLGLESDSANAECDYQKANSFNVLAGFWIQFMTHDWFSHLEEGHNAPALVPLGCQTQEARKSGCRPGDSVDAAYIAQDTDPSTFQEGGAKYISRAYRTTTNDVTAWWDASQLYGYDKVSRRRVKRDPADPAKFLLVQANDGSYLPILEAGDPMNPAWSGQESTAFADNWNIGLSFYHNIFAREHNAYVEAFRAQAARTPEADCGLRNPNDPKRVIRYQDVSADELFEVARLVVAAEIAKIHTIEWTTQLLYDEPLYRAMNANWSGLLGGDGELDDILKTIVARLGDSNDPRANQLYSVFASGAGIVGLGNARIGPDPELGGRRRDLWDISSPDDVNGGVKHFGSPFNFPEEFVTVYRLHPLVPDLIEYRELGNTPDLIRKRVPVVRTFRGLATAQMRSRGLANWALSMGRQRAGALTLQNHPQFLQNLPMDRLKTESGMLDVPALDLLRDRERGVPRYNEFRRQLGLRQLTSFDDFADAGLPVDAPARLQQQTLAQTMRELYGRHSCDASKLITDAQANDDGSPINDCLGHPDGSLVDNIEDVDAVVGWLAESTRPHGFAISETQFQVFVLEASRRLFSDRFFTSSFRPEFYTTLGVRWVNDNGPDGKIWEEGSPNGHRQEVSPFKRVLLRTVPELAPELKHVINVFDPWARDRGQYYSLEWRPRPGAEADQAFQSR